MPAVGLPRWINREFGEGDRYMKGLVLKDLMCLRKQLIIFGYVVVGVLVLSVMFVLSARFGNIAMASQAMMTTEDLSASDIADLSTNVLILFMLLPLATVGDFANVFTEDGKAGFYNLSSILPVSVKKRVLAKYVTIFAMFGIGALIDIIIAFVLSILTDIISFTDFLGIIISAASVMSVYSALVVVFCFLFGYGKEDYARIISPLLMLVTAVFLNFSKIRKVFIAGDVELINRCMNFIKHKSYVLLLTAVFVMVVSYFVSVRIAERKRGIV